MSKGESSVEENPKAPTATTLWCCPCLANACRCSSCCYNCCNKGAPCPFFYFCFPCCCCCCRPSGAIKGVDEEETVVPPKELPAEEPAETAAEGGEQEEEEAQAEEGEAAEGAAAEPEEAAGATAAAVTPSATTLKPKAKAKPRRAVSPAGKRAPKSSPAFFTGKAAGLPPPPKEACVGPPPEVPEPEAPVGLGAYLVYTTEEGGKLKTQWSKTPMTGAGIIAYLQPEKEVADYKFEKKKAIEIHATNCETCMASEFPADREKFYEGFAAFYKQLSAHGGSVVLLPAAAAEPPPKVKVVLFNKGKLSQAQVGQKVTATSFESLAIVPSNATKFDVKEMTLADFSTLAKSQGAYVNISK